MSPRALFVVLLSFILTTLAPAAGASDRTALRVAVVPYLTTSVLLKLFEPSETCTSRGPFPVIDLMMCA